VTSGACAGRGQVLFADDDVGFRRPLSVALHRAGFSVSAVGTADEVVERLEQERFDVVLADIGMPGNEQLQLTRRPRSAGAVPLVLITGQPSVATAVTALRRGVVDYVLKPVDPDELFLRLDAAIARARAARALGQAHQTAQQLVALVADAGSVLGEIAPTRAQAAPRQEEKADPLERLTVAELASLSPRERDVVRLLATGNAAAEVAKTLGLSHHTVRNHIKSVFVKLQIRSQLALMSRLMGRPGDG